MIEATMPVPDRPLVPVRLHGPLGERYGVEHCFAVNSGREAIAALMANHPGFQRDFLQSGKWAFLVDGDWRQTIDEIDMPVSRSIDICPVIEGEFEIAALLVTALIPSITGVAASIIGGVLLTGLLLGVSLLLTPKQPKKTKKDDPSKDDNYQFGGPENITAQGVAVPLLFGRCHAGSVVVSAGLHLAEEFYTGATGAPGVATGGIPGGAITLGTVILGFSPTPIKAPFQGGVPWTFIGRHWVNSYGNLVQVCIFRNIERTWIWDEVLGYRPL